MLKPEFPSKSKEYQKAYRQRAGVQAKAKVSCKRYYDTHKDLWKKYNADKEKEKKYRQRPEVKARIKTYSKSYNHRPEVVARRAIWDKLRQQDPKFKERRKQNMLIREYGLTMIEYQELLSSQNGQCAICGRSNWTGRGRDCSCIDHDHKTGVIRGILCHSCNTVLGLIKENKKTAINMIAYIEKHEAKK